MADYGVGVVVDIEGRAAIATLNAMGRAFAFLGGNMNRVRAGLAMAGKGFRGLALAAAPISLAMGAGVKMASDFEHAMSGVLAVSNRTTATWEQDFAAMRDLALDLGSTTAFTATQAAEGMQLLTRAGFSAQEVMGAIGPTLNAAAAEGMGLADASAIVANTLKGLGMEITDPVTGMNNAARVANVLALTSARTKTSMAELGEAFSYAALDASDLGFNLEETSAMLGILSNVGVESSRAGTTLRMALSKLVKPAGEAGKIMKKYGISLKDSSGRMKSGKELMFSLIDSFNQIQDPVDQARVASEVFGIRGKAAISALRRAGKEDLGILIEQLNNSAGAAQEMADIKLENFQGQLTILRSAVEGLSITFFTNFLDPLTGGLKIASSFIGDVAISLRLMGKEGNLTAKETEKLSKTSKWAQVMAKGFLEARNTVIDFGKKIVTWFGKARSFVEELFGPEQVTSVVKWGTIIMLALGAAVPVLVTLGMVIWGVSSAVSILGGAIMILSGAFWPVLIIVGAAYLLFQAFRREGESTTDTLRRLWTTAVAAFSSFKAGFMEAFGPTIQILRAELAPAFAILGQVAGAVFGYLSSLLGSSSGDITSWGQVVGSVAAFIVQAFLAILQAVGTVIGWLAFKVTQIVSFAMKAIKILGRLTGRTKEAKKAARELAAEPMVAAPPGRPAARVVAPAVRRPVLPAPVAPRSGESVRVTVQPPPPPQVRTRMSTSITNVVQIDAAEVAREVKKYNKETETRGGGPP